MTIDRIVELLGKEAGELLDYTCKGIPRAQLQLPGPDFIERVMIPSDRSPRVLGNFQRLLGHGRLGGTGYVSILPVDQGVEHSGSASFTPNPAMFDSDGIVRLAIEGGCNGVASTYGVLASVARRHAHRIPFIVKLNHNELLTYPNKYDQVFFANVEQAFDMGAVGVGTTIYFGSDESSRQIQEVAAAFAMAHDLGLMTILWCYLRNNAFKRDKDYHTAADLTSQAIHLGATLGADIVKQKLPTLNRGYEAVNTEAKYGQFDKRMYTDLMTDHPIDFVRLQVAHAYMGRIGVINSGGESGKNDLAAAVRTAVINKRAGGMGLISGRKAFQKPVEQGIELLNAIQDVYLSPEITVA